ncbi:LemA family protein [Shewanella oncorhynchi]|uniref:LemA family protein n=1 Tax=Shewanella oncorhynchi TaxID=2726434 RepID=UPI003D7B7099
MDIILILFVLFCAFAVWSVFTYNSLQSKKQSLVEQASNIQVSLQKRRDLASRVIDIAQGYGDHEKLTHLKISADQQASTQSLAALSQSFPELKANETYSKLMNQLEDLEDNIAMKRETYNKHVNIYNSYRSSFPTMLVANKLSFDSAPYYNADNEDTLGSLAIFNRDDSEAVKNLISTSSQTLKSSAKYLKASATTHIENAKQSETFKSVVDQGDIAITKVVEAAKTKIEKKEPVAEQETSK